MLINEGLVIQRLLSSKQGTHLTAYLKGCNGCKFDLREQLGEVLESAQGSLSELMSVDKMDEFLRPIRSMHQNDSMLLLLKGNLGIFRTPDSFDVLSIPVDVRTSCTVANTFQVRPLLRWLRTDESFFLLGLGEFEAQLYFGTQHILNKVASISYADLNNLVLAQVPVRRRLTPMQRIRPLIAALYEWLDRHMQDQKSKLFVAGERHLSEVLIRARHYRNVERNPVWSSFHDNQLPLIVEVIRKMCRREHMLQIDRAIYEHRQSQSGELVVTF